MTQDKQKTNAGKTSQRKRNITLILLAIIIVAAVAGSATYMSRLGTTSAPTTPSPIITLTTSSPTQTPAEQPANKTPTELRVFAAGSLMHVMEKQTESFGRENNAKVMVNFASADMLYTQIYSGSPCDVFMSADSKWTKKLKTDGLLDNDQYWNFTTNKLIVILPADNPGNVTSLSDLTRPNTKIALGTWRIPVGAYTNMTLTKIQKSWGNRSDPRYKGPEWEHYRDKIISNVVSYEPMVTSVTTKVLLGVVDAGIVFASEAKFEGPKLQYVEIPSSVNTIGTFGIAVIKDTTNRDLATKYVNFWLSEEGQRLLADYGFGATP